MKIATTILLHSFRRVRLLVLATGGVLGVFQVFLILIAGSIHRSQAFDQISMLLPPVVRELLGPAMSSILSFQGIVGLGYFHLAVLTALVAVSISLGTMLTGEIQAGWMDLVLARPVARHWMITRGILVQIGSSAALLIMMMTGTWIGLATLAPAGAVLPAPRLVLSLAVNLGLLMLAWSAIAMGIGAAFRRRGPANGLAALLALATFLLDYIARAWKPAATVAWISPFRYYNPFDLIMGRPLALRDLLVLGSLAAAGYLAAFFLFSRRDIQH